MSIPAAHLSLFKADWIGDPDRLKVLARRHKYNDLFTAELAAWCAEVHEHLHDLEDTVGVDLLLMGGDLNILLASFTNSSQWEAMVAYGSARYARECETWTIDASAGEPNAEIRDRLQLWASCSNSSSERWGTIRAVQQTQRRQQVRRGEQRATR